MREEDKDDFVETLLEWHDANGRHDLPWRDPTASPFEVLVAELMLQQFSAGQVFGVYGEFVERYPTAGALLAAPEANVVDDSKSGRERVQLPHEEIDGYDAEFYATELVRAAESVLSPSGWRREDIREYLSDRVESTIRAFSV